MRRLKKKFRSGNEGSWPPEHLENDNMSFLDAVRKKCQGIHLSSIRLVGKDGRGYRPSSEVAQMPIENCSAAIHAEHERREAEAQLREPPREPAGFIPGQSPRMPRGGLFPQIVVVQGADGSNPQATSSPRTPRHGSVVPNTPLSTRSEPGSIRRRLRDRGNLHRPVRFSPKSNNSILRADSDSGSSAVSTASGTLRRRRGRRTPSTRDGTQESATGILMEELSTIHEVETDVGNGLLSGFGNEEDGRLTMDAIDQADQPFSPARSQGSRRGVRGQPSPAVSAVSLTLSAQRREARAATLARRDERLQVRSFAH